jgi:hypothetical protein
MCGAVMRGADALPGSRPHHVQKAVRDRLDSKMGPISDETLQKMADVIGTSEPISIETV